jgi:hypothetical protein
MRTALTDQDRKYEDDDRERGQPYSTESFTVLLSLATPLEPTKRAPILAPMGVKVR